MTKIELDTRKNGELGLWEVEATLTLPPITVTRCKKDKDDLKYELRRAFSDIVEEIVEKMTEHEF